jgi:biopolymer transport protein ExbB
MSQLLLRFALLGENWILILLGVLSVASVAAMIDRFAFFALRGFSGIEQLAGQLRDGDFAAARVTLSRAKGMEGEVLNAALDAAPRGAEAVEEVIAGGILRQRLQYERFLAFLGTLGNNAPFIGLLGTVLGIIRAFHDLAMSTPGQQAQGPQTVMAGISQALIATAVGLFVALPAVVAFNSFQRWLKTITSRTQTLGHALVSFLRSPEGP